MTEKSELEQTRKTAADAIRTFCRSLGDGVVMMSVDGQERIYYSGISLDALSVAVALAIHRATAGHGDGREWQPIETAPKDRTWVLVWETGVSDKYHPAEVARFINERWESSAKKYVEAAYWQPLPDPPTPGHDDEPAGEDQGASVLGMQKGNE